MKIGGLLILCLLSVFLLTGCTPVSQSGQTEAAAANSIKDHSMILLQVGGNTLTVEAVNSADSITKGLGDRDTIGSDGMLFFLPNKQVAQFWMKDMRFNLDMVWIDDDKVIGVTANIPVEPKGADLPTYSSGQKVDKVLELPAGDAKKRSITAGDQVVITQLKQK